MGGRRERLGAGALVETVVAFGARLRGHGIEVGPGRVEAAVRALECVDPGDPDDLFWALRCSMLSRHEDAELFEQVFRELLADTASAGMRLERPAETRAKPGVSAAAGEEIHSAAEVERLSEHADEPAGEDEDQGDPVGSTYSPVERLRRMDFPEWGPDEITAARPLFEQLARRLPMRRSRRLRSSHRGDAIDRRGTLRRSMRTGGHPLELLGRERVARPRRIVFLVDVSGSMEAYARPVIVFCQAVRQVSRRVEAFAFGTRLTRLTRELADRDTGRALKRAAQAVPDWAGGTRIGANLATLNREWGRRGIVRGAIVVIFSDGWERGDLELLAQESARLHRVAHAVIWVNPLAGEAGYEPLAAGMATALPHVDGFLPGHDLASLEQLVAVLDELAEVSEARRRLVPAPGEVGALSRIM